MVNIIFDMDGTLLDTQKIYVPAWEYAGKAFGVEGMGNCVFELCGSNGETCKKFMTEKYPNVDYGKFRELIESYIKEHATVRFKKGAKEFIDYLIEKEIPFALATSTARKGARERLESVGYADKFKVTVCGDEVTKGKPDPEPFLKAAQKLGADPETCIVFEDSPLGIRAAHTAGMKVVGVFDLVEFSDEIKSLMYAELEDLSEAIALVEGLANS